jgi:hypothetical protein
MHMRRIRSRLLQILYRPPGKAKPRWFTPGLLASMDRIDKAIDEKITPLLSGLWD